MPINNSIIDLVPTKSGVFNFEVQSIDRDMNYSPIASVKYIIKKPWFLEASTAIPFWGVILSILAFSGYSRKKYNNQKNYSLKLKEEAQVKDRDVRKKLELNNAELVESQKAAEAANAAKSTFLANMSHELRTPLNAIIGYSEMLIEDAEDENEDFIPDLDKINGSGKHLLGLINDILDLSKVESGKMELFIEEFELSKILQEIEATIKPLVEKNNNNLIVNIGPKIKTIKADITKIRQIMLNLLSNSSKFTKNGEITFSIVDSKIVKDAYDFVVSDSGIGMSQEQVDKVFKPFTQADEKTTRKFGGTGLGLTITKMFAEMMGGEINLKSKEGEGTTFTVTIPKVVKELKEDTSELTTTIDTENPYTILVIDDDNNAQDMMKKYLQKQGISILQAKSGEEGLKLAIEHMPDAITLDVMMPEMDGWEVLSAIQANDKIKNIPVIMLTMADEPDLGFSLGATDYLTKPVNWNQLSSILKKHQIQSNSESIMIVEDDEITRDMLRKSLESNNFKVKSAINGKEALEKIKIAKPGLIILDLMMPEMDGFEFSEKLRENKDWLDIPVVVITAKDLTKEDHSRLKGNVEAIMQKGSYSKKELLAEVGERIKKLQTQG
jgi:signal transduction histidine kinase/DNA-binding response OmpR family regulator